mgnify:CR=1 FL=1
MFERQSIPDVILVPPKRHGDARGFFSETYSAETYEAAGIPGPFVQDNHAFSQEAGVLRGLHFQKPPAAQAKLIRCTQGAIFDVAVDIRQGSPTYGKWVGATLSAENGAQLYVPEGFAHGYLTLTPNCHVQYKVSDYYAPDQEGGIAWDDPGLAIAWPLDGLSVTLSEKDQCLTALSALPAIF